ncbi:MAG: DEAD/DEAH box helicase family protein [Gracilibacteraceae bacterium]|jgi:competence protein ComFA|nr:DEAD/DEAH box helicase family protein [Gracilibacteraceae bacterium]
MLFHLLRRAGAAKKDWRVCPEEALPAFSEEGEEVLGPALPLAAALACREGARLPAGWVWEKIGEGTVDHSLRAKALALWLEKRVLLEGRQAGEAEREQWRRAWELSPAEMAACLHTGVLGGEAEWTPAVSRPERGKAYCARCGAAAILWPSIYGPAATCPACASLGALTSLQALFRCAPAATGRKPPFSGGGFPAGEDETAWLENWPGGLVLTPAQQRAAQEFLRWLPAPQEKILLWAACGAGKTEVCFPLLRAALAAGARVLFAAPRRDVIHDVLPRLERAFPETEVLALSGALGAPLGPARLVAATVHQAMRFYRAFDLIIFDEIDAFPYKNDAALSCGLERAGRPDCKRALLSATPAPDTLLAMRAAGEGIVRLPARHHRRPLPTPAFARPAAWQTLAARLRPVGPVLLFVPVVAAVAEWVDRLQALYPDAAVAGSHSSDPERAAKVEALKRGEYDFFVSTMILERGVTVPGVQVLVLEADHRNYDTPTLVQLAGRAGRTAAQPAGEVFFLAGRPSPAMREAVRLIAEQNALAAELGLLSTPPPPRRSRGLASRFARPAPPPWWPPLRAALRDLWYGENESCLLCGAPAAAALCPDCQGLYFLPDLPRCPGCGKLLETAAPLCRTCAAGAGPRDLTGACALGWYGGDYRDLIRRVKYRGQPFILARLAPCAIRHALGRLPPPDWIVPTPLSAQRLRNRGYNQAEALASFLGGELGTPVRSVLRRTRLTAPQAGLSRSERLANVQGAFACDRDASLRGKRIWLIDDVLTTGATASACARELRAAGCGEVFALVLAAGRE